MRQLRADGGGEVRLSCTQREQPVPVSHRAVLYGEPKTNSMRQYCGKHWSLVISHLILSNTQKGRGSAVALEACRTT